jgi:exopolyphosphatase/guanosine-5'-triphosphate,3'-diphosphate pyrophosphatase
VVVDWRGKNFTSDTDPVAVIDIGSNSIRLVIYESEVRSPTPILNEKLLCGLGRNRQPDGRLNENAVQRALNILPRFRKLCEQTKVKRIYAFATEATRRATDGGEFIAAAEQASSCQIQVLDGEEEARLAAAGILAGFNNPDGFAGDLGGGSLELIDIKDREIGNKISLPLGSLNLMETSGKNYTRVTAHIESHLKTVDWLKNGRGRPFHIIGGTWRSVARLHMLETRYPLSIMHHYRMSVRDIATLCSKVVTRNPKILNLSRISRERQEMLPYGLLLLKCLVDTIRPSEVLVSALGIREGMLYMKLPPEEQLLDPLLTACQDMAARRARSYDYADEFFNWTSGLFGSETLKETAEETRLRHAACYLSDIGWRGHQDYRGEKALGLIAQSAFVGVEHSGRAFMALAVYYSHKPSSSGDFSPALRKLAGREWNRRAQILGAAARTGFKLSANMPGIINQTPIRYTGSELVLSMPESLKMLAGQHVLRRLEVLAKLLKCRAEIRIEPQPDAPKSLLQVLRSRG